MFVKVYGENTALRVDKYHKRTRKNAFAHLDLTNGTRVYVDSHAQVWSRPSSDSKRIGELMPDLEACSRELRMACAYWVGLDDPTWQHFTDAAKWEYMTAVGFKMAVRELEDRVTFYVKYPREFQPFCSL